MSFTEKQKIIINLVHQCVRNIAYCDVHISKDISKNYHNITTSIHNNYMDIATLAWCKLLSRGKNEKYGYLKMLNDPAEFESEIYKYCLRESFCFCQIQKQLVQYRNKYLAHQDKKTDLKGVVYPPLDEAKKAIHFYYKYYKEEQNLNITGLLSSVDKIYSEAQDDASNFYDCLVFD